MSLDGGKKKNISGLTYFGADWCGFCNEFNPTWKKLNKLLKDLSIKTNKIDVDNNKDLVKKYKVKSFPTIIYVKKKGKGVYRFDEKQTRNIKNILKFCKKCHQRDQ